MTGTYSDKKIQGRIGFNPHPKQREILDCKEREIVLCAGRRFGKSALCAYIALKVILEPEKKVWIVSPSYDLSLKVFEYLAKWVIKLFPDSASGAISYRPYPKIKLPNGSVLECKSAENPTGLLGEELDLLIVDEASRIQKNVYETYLFPTTASRRGKIIFISTPFGKNWFYHQWVKNKENDSSFRFESRDNPHFPPEEWDRARGMLPERVFKQEYLAEFLEGAASVFRSDKIREIINDNALKDVHPYHSYVMGVDLGKHEDFTVLTVIDQDTSEVVFFDRFQDIDWNIQKNRIIQAANRYNARIVIDSTGVGDPIAEDLRYRGMFVEDFKYSGKSKQQLIEKLAIFIEDQRVIIPNNEYLIDELESFGYQITDSGKVRYGAPDGMHDDCVNSLALAVWLLQGERPKPQRIFTDFTETNQEKLTRHLETLDKPKLIKPVRL